MRRIRQRRSFSRRRRFVRRTFRRSRRTIRGRMMSIRRPKIEVKRYDTFNGTYPLYENSVASSVFTGTLTPAGMARGTAVNERIGQKIKFLRVTMRAKIEPIWLATNRSSVMYRVLIGYGTQQLFGSSFQASVQNGIFDSMNNQTMVVLYDQLFTCYNPTTVGITIPGGMIDITIKRYFPFPRRVAFDENSNLILQPKDVLQMVIVPQYAPTVAAQFPSYQVQWGAKTSYIDP